jgi:Cu/Ag efflux protein CusF
MNKLIKFGFIGLMAIAVVGTPVALHAQATNAPAKKASAKSPTNKTIPFHGNIKAIDNTAKTISIGNEIIQVTSETKITKLGKPATLSDGIAGEPVAGAYHKGTDGKLDAVSVRFGPKPAAETSNKQPKKP